MSNPNPHVSVFHFTSRISNAKIKKYKLATERGMGSGNMNGDSSRKPGPSQPVRGRLSRTSITLSSPVSESGSMQPPPAKKPRLRLNPRSSRRHDSIGDTIAVARPKRNVSMRSQKSQEIVVDDDEAGVNSPGPSPRLTSLSPAQTTNRGTSSPQAGTPKSARDDYGDFMSYYIAGGEDEEKPHSIVKSKLMSKGKPNPSKQEQPPRKQSRSILAQRKPALEPDPVAEPCGNTHIQAQFKVPHPQDRQQHPPGGVQIHQQYGPPSQHVPSMLPPPPPPPLQLPQPIIQVIDLVCEPRPAQPDTVAVMIKKLEALSMALTNFGGVHAVPRTPSPEVKPTSKPFSKANSHALDIFLANCKDDEETQSENETESPDYRLSHSGVSDGPLTYGIQFIMNALRSWAEQRLKHQFAQQFQEQQLLLQQHGSHAHFGQPGQQDKYGRTAIPFQLPAQPVIQLNLAETPEGVAIGAFQAVLDSGCLRTNAVLPAELTRALRHLYIQIDNLINQGSESKEPWQCMSYGAQIAAQKDRVEKWKDAHMRALEESARQQQLAQQQVMMQMGLTGSDQVIHEGVQTSHAPVNDPERRRSMQFAVQHPYISQPNLNQLQLGSHLPPNLSTPYLPYSARGGPIMSPGLEVATMQRNLPPEVNGMLAQHGAAMPPQVPSAFSKGSASSVQLDKMKLYMPGFLPRSGQSMKFSFAPHNEAAVRVFGSQAFPTNEPLGPNIPNRGPMTALPAQVSPMPAATGGYGNGPGAIRLHARSVIPNGVEVIDLASSSPQQIPMSASHRGQSGSDADLSSKPSGHGDSRVLGSQEPVKAGSIAPTFVAQMNVGSGPRGPKSVSEVQSAFGSNGTAPVRKDKHRNGERLVAKAPQPTAAAMEQ